MAGFLDVLLRGVMLTAGAVALGGVVFLLAIVRVVPGSAPDVTVRRALRLIAAGAAGVGAAQLAIVGIALGALAPEPTAAAAFAQTPFATAATVRVVLAVLTTVAAYRLIRRPRAIRAWQGLAAAAALLVASSAAISHAAARMDHRAILLAFDAAHQVAAAVWIGGLVHLLVALGSRAGASVGSLAARGTLVRRFSTLALTSVSVLVVAGFALSVAYVGDPGALLETAYGVMVLTKGVLLAAILALAAVSFRLVRRIMSAPAEHRLRRLVEVEAGLAITVLFAAASLTSVPPAVDVQEDRATLGEVVARFTAIPPRLVSPNVDDLLRQTNPLGGGPETRLRIEREWSEFNHHWAGVFVLAMGLAAIAQRWGVRAARHWPLLLIGLAALLVVRNDPEVWPIGPIGFWASLAQPEIVQHRAFMVLVMLFGVFEWAVRIGRLSPRPWAYVFPVLCAVAGGLLLTHSHAIFDAKEGFLMEVTHAPIGVLGAGAGWARWLELRLPDAADVAGRIWPACLTMIGLLLLVYSEGGGG